MLQALKQDPASHRGCQGREPGEGQFGIIDYAPQQAERISGSGHSNKASSQQACQSPVLQAAARCRAVDNHEIDDWRTNQRISPPGDASGCNFLHTSGACLNKKKAKRYGLPSIHSPGIEPGTRPWQGRIIPLDYECLLECAQFFGIIESPITIVDAYL